MKLIAIYMKLPPALQSIMCSLDTFVLVENHVSLASVYSYRSTKGKPVYGISFSKLMFESNVKFAEILTRYDADLLRYPKSKSKWERLGTDYRDVIPQFRIGENERVKLNLYFTVAHELGHFLDKITESTVSVACTNLNRDEKSCSQKIHPWLEFSWKDFETPSLESGFPEKKPICYYDNECDSSTNITALEDVRALYQMLDRSSFVSLYAVASADEDFADSVAFIALRNNFPNVSIEAYLGDGLKYDHLRKVDSERFAKKKKFIESLLDRANIGNRQLLERMIPLL